MAQRPVEKHYGERTLQQKGDGYLQMSIPRSVVDDTKTDFEAGSRVTVQAVINGDDAYIKIERVSDE